MKTNSIAWALAVLAGTGSAMAAVSGYTGTMGFGSITGDDDYEDIASWSSPGQPFSSSGGLTYDINPRAGSFVIWGPAGGVGFPTSNSLYVNGGASGLITFTPTGGADLEQVEFDVGNGFGQSTTFVYAKIYNNGSWTGEEFKFDVTTAGRIGFQGSGYDEVRWGAYDSASSRDAAFASHSESSFHAGSMDNLVYGSMIPAPGALALLGLGGIAAARRARR